MRAKSVAVGSGFTVERLATKRAGEKQEEGDRHLAGTQLLKKETSGSSLFSFPGVTL